MKLANTNNSEKLKYSIILSIPLIDSYFDLINWCNDYESDGMFDALPGYGAPGNLVDWKFEKEEDATIFSLRWS